MTDLDRRVEETALQELSDQLGTAERLASAMLESLSLDEAVILENRFRTAADHVACRVRELRYPLATRAANDR